MEFEITDGCIYSWKEETGGLFYCKRSLPPAVTEEIKPKLSGLSYSGRLNYQNQNTNESFASVYARMPWRMFRVREQQHFAL